MTTAPSSILSQSKLRIPKELCIAKYQSQIAEHNQADSVHSLSPDCIGHAKVHSIPLYYLLNKLWENWIFM